MSWIPAWLAVANAPLIGLTLACPARAGEPTAPPVDIHWSAPSECPSQDQLRTDIARLLRGPRAPTPAAVAVKGEVSRSDAAARPYRLRLHLTDRNGTRERALDGDTCAQVTAAAAVVIALAIDSGDSGPLPVPVPVPPAAPPAQSAVPAIEPSPAPPSVERVRAWDFSVLAGLDAAALPGPALGAAIRAGYIAGDHRFEAEGSGWSAQHAAVGVQPTAGVDVALYAAALRYCRSLGATRIAFSPCVGTEAGALVARGVDIVPASVKTSLWLAPELGVVATLPVGSRLALSLEVDGLVPLWRTRFTVAPVRTVFQPALATARLLLGVHVRFQ